MSIESGIMKNLPSILAALLLSFLTACTSGPSGKGGPDLTRIIRPTTLRALWVDSWGDGLYTPEQCDRMIAWAVENGFNTLLVEVRKTGDAYYRSQLVPRGRDVVRNRPLDHAFDALDYILRRAKGDHGLRVEAWLVANRVWKGVADPEPTAPLHVVLSHPEWLLIDKDGEVRQRVAGDSISLDPSDPGARAHVARVAGEVARRYPVDGIHLDYIRYPSGPWGYGERSLRRYRDATGAGTTPSADDPRFIRWKADQVTTEVREIRNAVKLANPDIDLTAAVVAWGAPDPGGYRRTKGYLGACQDWPDWCERGLVDGVYVMHYKREGVAAQAKDFRAWLPVFMEIRKRSPGFLAVGLAAYLNTRAETASQESESLAAGADGTAWFSYRTPVRARP